MVRLETPNRTAADDQTFNRPGGRMATDGKDETVSLQELLVTSLAQTDAVAKLLCIRLLLQLRDGGERGR